METPFEVPKSYVLESPFESAAPRPLPDRFRDSIRVQRARQNSLNLGVAAVVCVYARNLGYVKYLALYLVPLEYLDWIGGALLLFAIALYVQQSTLKLAEHRVVRNGVPRVGRVIAAGKVCTMVVNGVPTYTLRARVEYLRDGRLVEEDVDAFQISYMVADQFSTSLEAGQYVTLVQAGRQYLYGFLQVDPEVDYIVRDTTTVTWLRPALSIVAFLGLLGMLYAFIRYMPAAGPAVTTGVCVTVGATLLFVAIRQLTSRLRPIIPHPAITGWGRLRRLRSMLAGWLCTVAAVFSLAFSINAGWDRSPSHFEPVVIDNYVQETWDFLFRQYSIDFHFENESPSRGHRTLVTPLEMDAISSRNARVEMGTGYFGWPWIRQVVP